MTKTEGCVKIKEIEEVFPLLFSDKMTKIPQPRRADLWDCYRTLCTALALNVTLTREERPPTEEELTPLKQGAERANLILAECGMEPSFFPEAENFFPLLLAELTKITHQPKRKD